MIEDFTQGKAGEGQEWPSPRAWDQGSSATGGFGVSFVQPEASTTELLRFRGEWSFALSRRPVFPSMINWLVQMWRP
ncbi:hypothetical protein [Kribbella sp. NPDC023855]|uniref:hypothetical protein n=1 Tax=Kribbella sp. NPDC023855 TaxID=3154698 RepID=UPI0033FD305D